MTVSGLPVGSPWFTTEDLGEGVTVLTEPFVSGLIRANLFLVRGRDRDLLVDAGNGVAPLMPALRAAGASQGRDIIAVATHAHIDHVGGLHEFAERLIHAADAEVVTHGFDFAPLVTTHWDEDFKGDIEAAGISMPEVLVRAVPDERFDPAAFRVEPSAPTRLLADGDVVDLGDRRFTAVHLPGHTPGSIVLLEERTGLLFTGDVVYDGELIDTLPESDVGEYVLSMARLLELPVSHVLPGHDELFDRARLQEIASQYLALH